MMTEWINIEPASIDVADVREGHEGVEIIYGLSPDDVPQKMRAYIDQNTKELVVVFKYLTPTQESRDQLRSIGGPVTPVLGSHSKRLYELRFSVPTDRLRQDVCEAVDELSKDRRFARRSQHYRAAAKAFSGHAASILSGNYALTH